MAEKCYQNYQMHSYKKKTQRTQNGALRNASEQTDSLKPAPQNGAFENGDLSMFLFKLNMKANILHTCE